jgi:hypothetical protein
MRFLFVFLIPFLCLKVHAKELTPLEISKIIFPQTVTWTNIQSMPKPTDLINKQSFQPLKEAYLKSQFAAYEESENCSFIERMTEEFLSGYKNIYSYDIDADGDLDYVYSGGAQCSEGYATIIWFRENGKLLVKQEYLYQAQALSTKFDGSIHIASYSGGCCGDPIDQYYLGTVEQSIRDLAVRTPQKLVFPDKYQGSLTPVKYKVDAEFTLRSEPKVSDAFEESESQFMSQAVFGNVLTKYLAGCELEIITTQTANNGEQWRFVYVPEACDYLRTHVPYMTNFGWIK